MVGANYEWMDFQVNIESLYNSIRIDELLSKSEELSKRWTISSRCFSAREWILEFEVEEILIDAKIRFE